MSYHVDNNKISYVDSEVVSQVINETEKKFGKNNGDTWKRVCVSRNEHNFRGNSTFVILMM